MIVDQERKFYFSLVEQIRNTDFTCSPAGTRKPHLIFFNKDLILREKSLLISCALSIGKHFPFACVDIPMLIQKEQISHNSIQCLDLLAERIASV